MVLGPASSAPVAVAWFGCLFAGGFWHAQKEIPSESVSKASTLSMPVAVPENARLAIEGILEEPVINQHEVKEILEKPAIREQEVKEIFEKPVINKHEVKEILEKPAINEQEDSDSFPTLAIFESKMNLIHSKSLELLDEVIQNCTDEKEGTPSQFAIPEYDLASIAIEDIKQVVMNALENNDIHTNLINIFSSNSSPLVWAIVASWPIDLFLIFCMCGCCRRTKVTARGVAVTISDVCKNSNDDVAIEANSIEHTTNKSKVIVWLGEKDVTTQGEFKQDSDIACHEEGPEEITLPNAEVEVSPDIVQRSKRKSQQDLKAIMEKKRAECEVVENTQTLVSTDAKAPEQAKFKWHSSRDSEDQSNGQTRAKCRNSSDLKALMEKKRDQCQVVESAQEHIETDAKASCHDALDVVG